jgi:uncharacterized protein
MFILLVCLITLLAALIQGITGFGFALVAAPLLSLLLTEKESILLIVLFFTTPINFYLFLRYKKYVQFKLMRRLILPALLGVGVGTLLLPVLPAGVLTILIGAISLYLAFTMLIGYKLKTSFEKAVNYAGVASGFFNVTTGLGGPPIVLLMAQQKAKKKQMLGSLATFFLALNVVSIAGIVMTMKISDRLPGIILAASPAALIGLLIGIAINDRINDKHFQRFVLGLIVVSGSLALYKGVSTLL